MLMLLHVTLQVKLLLNQLVRQMMFSACVVSRLALSEPQIKETIMRLFLN